MLVLGLTLCASMVQAQNRTPPCAHPTPLRLVSDMSVAAVMVQAWADNVRWPTPSCYKSNVNLPEYSCEISRTKFSVGFYGYTSYGAVVWLARLWVQEGLRWREVARDTYESWDYTLNPDLLRVPMYYSNGAQFVSAFQMSNGYWCWD